MHLPTTSSSPEETAAIGRLLGSVLLPGDVVALEGDLGAGKTTLVRALVEGMGGQGNHVSSPTFTIAQEYETPRGVVVHVDAYRLDPDSDELGPMGFDRLADGQAAVLIEWPEKLAGRVRFDATIRLAHSGEESREIAIDMPNDWSDRGGYAALTDLLGEPRMDTVCPATGQPVPADSPSWPFANERARMADLYGWFSEKFTVTRPIEERDLEEDA